MSPPKKTFSDSACIEEGTPEPEFIKELYVKMTKFHNITLDEDRAELAKLTERRVALLRKMEGLPAQSGFVEKVDTSRWTGNIYEGEVR